MKFPPAFPDAQSDLFFRNAIVQDRLIHNILRKGIWTALTFGEKEKFNHCWILNSRNSSVQKIIQQKKQQLDEIFSILNYIIVEVWKSVIGQGHDPKEDI